MKSGFNCIGCLIDNIPVLFIPKKELRLFLLKEVSQVKQTKQ